MSYLVVNRDVEIDYSDISDIEILWILEDRIDTHASKSEKNPNKLKDFVSDVIETLSDANVPLDLDFSNKTLEDELYDEVFALIKQNFTLSEVQEFAKTKCKYL